MRSKRLRLSPAATADEKVAELELQTDANGMVRVPPERAGAWNVRAAYAVAAAPNSGADWDVYCATFVFRAR